MGFYFPFKFSPKNYDEITIMENGCMYPNSSNNVEIVATINDTLAFFLPFFLLCVYIYYTEL
jgi:hypothetical protein